MSQDELKKQLLTDKVYTRLNKTGSRITVLPKQFNSRIRPLKQFNSRIRPSNIPAHALLLEILYAMPLSGSVHKNFDFDFEFEMCGVTLAEIF